MTRNPFFTQLTTMLMLSCMMALSVTGRATEVESSDVVQAISLAGEWQFRLDRADEGVRGKWFLGEMPDLIRLPGSTDEQGFGDPANKPEMFHLTREHSYVGPAWYRREVTIPQDWEGKRISLFLERCHWETRVWVDGEEAGMQDSLSVPHVYDLTPWLKPGKHTIALRVDNRLKINVGHTFGGWSWATSVTDQSQTNWNGVIGRLALEASDPVRLESLQLHPNLKENKLTVKAEIDNQSGAKLSGQLALETAPDCGSLSGHVLDLAPGTNKIEVSVALKDARLWDEFTPNLYQLKATVTATHANQTFGDRREVTFGLREIGRDGNQLTINGRKVFLRGNLDCCGFPLTGYPPMDVAGWKHVIKKYQDFGMNHMRFHSWCPPEAAFVAADEMGVILQVEAPVWDGYGLLGRDADRAAWVLQEVDRILDAYGNHPSFCLMSMGNEWGDGKDEYLRYLVEFSRYKDPRRYYTATTHPAVPGRNDDYFVSAGTNLGIVRGLGPLENNRPSTQHDFRAMLAGQDRPFIVHEVGQPAQYPDFAQIAKYTGHLKPRNLEAFRDLLTKQGMLDQNQDFVQASGALAARIYKENIEAILRMPGISGFQLLGLQDFPGYGFISSGILDAFWDTKGVISPEQWRQFCSPTVPLARFRNFVWTADQPFAAQVEVAHYGPSDLKQAQGKWEIVDTRNKALAAGEFTPVDIATGGNTPLGAIGFDWAGVKAPARLTLMVWLEGSEAANQWPLWVYPATVDDASTAGVLVAEEWNDEVKTTLAQGGRVLLLPRPGALSSAESTSWHPLACSYQLWPTQKKTMGILCDPQHPALADFPTEFFGDFQWYDLLERADAINLDATPAEFRPIVQVISDFNFNHKLGAILETKVGAGRLLVCSMDLQRDLASRPEARQLRRSLLTYMQGEQFQPTAELTPVVLDALLQKAVNPNAATAPSETTLARLHVKAAGMIEKLGFPEPWQASADKVLKQEPGFSYQVSAHTWRDGVGSAWSDPHLTVTIHCPRDFQGDLYVHFHDWNNLNRNAHLFFDGRDLGQLGRLDGQGLWLKLPVTKANSEDGQLTLDARVASGPNVVITELVVMNEKK